MNLTNPNIIQLFTDISKHIIHRDVQSDVKDERREDRKNVKKDRITKSVAESSWKKERKKKEEKDRCRTMEKHLSREFLSFFTLIPESYPYLRTHFPPDVSECF